MAENSLGKRQPLWTFYLPRRWFLFFPPSWLQPQSVRGTSRKVFMKHQFSERQMIFFLNKYYNRF